jgi:hypothetical protein
MQHCTPVRQGSRVFDRICAHGRDNFGTGSEEWTLIPDRVREALRTRESSSAIDYENTWSRTGKQKHSLHLSPPEPALLVRACAG